MRIQAIAITAIYVLGSGVTPYAHASYVDTNSYCGDSSAPSAHAQENSNSGTNQSIYDISRGPHDGTSTPTQFEPSRDSRYEKKSDHHAEESGYQWSSASKWHDNKSLPLNLCDTSVNGHPRGTYYHNMLDGTPAPVPLGDSLPLFASALAALGLRYRKRLMKPS